MSEALEAIDYDHAQLNFGSVPDAAVVDLPPLTDEQAEAILARYNRHAQHAATIRANAEALIGAEQRICARILEEHGDRLKAWTAGKLRGNRRSVRTLEGVAGFRTVPARWKITDEGAALAHVQAHFPEAVVTIVTVNTKRLPAPALLATGHEDGTVQWPSLPGLEAVPERDTFYIRPGTPLATTKNSEEPDGI